MRQRLWPRLTTSSSTRFPSAATPTTAAAIPLLAHGTVGNLAFASPLPVGMVNVLAAGQVQFTSDTNWLYTLEQSADFQTWTAAAPASFGNGTNLLLQATNAPAAAFYRVRADLP